jgi:cardiolipin synthase A/B
MPRTLLVLFCAALGTAACAALPQRVDATPPVRLAALPEAAITVQGRNGPLPAATEKRVIEAVKAEGRPDLAEHHLRVLAASGEVDLYRGNATRLLVDGPATFAAMKAAIGRARERILFESYIFEDSRIAAEMAALLTRKAQQGVAVALLVDAVGSIGATPQVFEQLAEGGVAVCKFNPLNPLERPGYWGINHRNHRKVLVVDQEVAFTGGINISSTYSSGSSGAGRSRAPRPRDDATVLEDGWRDTHIELRGPVVPAFAKGFQRVWQQQGCKGSLGRVTSPPPAAAGERVVKLIESDPRDEANRLYTALLAAIDAAQRSVHLTMAYFAPGQEMVDALANAARRGVDVALVLPGKSDFSLILHAGRSYYTQMLEAGVRLHEMDDAMMHAKTAVIDGVLSTVGSSNMDWRSFVMNNEVNVIVLGAEFGAQLEALFRRDLERSRTIEAAAWSRRGLVQRTLELVGRMAERLL